MKFRLLARTLDRLQVRTLALLIVTAAPAWASPDPIEPATPRKLKALTLDLGKQKMSDLKRAGRVDELTLTGPYDSGW